jgi:hypothetical protein
MHDGAPTHFSHAVRDVLNNNYHVRWIVEEGLTAWPPRSLDLNSLDCSLWGHLNTQLLLTKKLDLNIALWMPVKLSAFTSASLNVCGGPSEMCRGLH